MPTYSRAHRTLKTLVETTRHGTLANRLGISTNSLRGILLGAVPKVTVAITMSNILDIPLGDWKVTDEMPESDATGTLDTSHENVTPNTTNGSLR